MGEHHWKTAITHIEQNKILVRGYPISELMGKITFGQAVYLLLRGELPPEGTGKMLDAIMISSIDHGPEPPSCHAAMTAASTGAPINAALAAGMLSINEFHGGAIENCMRALLDIRKKMEEKNLSAEDAAQELLAEYRARNRRFHGLGHRVHTNDPRTARIFAMAEELGVSGTCVTILKAIEDNFRKAGKTLPINVDGAIGAILCDLGFEPWLANAFFIMSRIPGMLAHIKEEKERYKPMRVIDTKDWEYDGPAERSM